MTRRAAVLVGIIGLASAGCAGARAAASDGVTPTIAISPGVAGRLALMDRYRLHDEDRKHMMERPHVWVEEAPDDEARDDETPDATSVTGATNEGDAERTGPQPEPPTPRY